MEDNTILEYVRRGGKQAWIGRKTPFDMTEIDMLNSSGYRVSSTHHHRYDVVWFFETLLDDVGKLGWKIVVDELTRLIAGKGYLIIRIRNNGIPSYVLLKRFLGRHIGLKTEVAYERYDRENDVWVAVFQITRLQIEKYTSSDWTFAVLTTGKKVENVVRFLKSIRENELNGESEIIIAGPQNERYDVYRVKYIDMSQFRDSEYAEISKKKNTIIKTATKANLMIVHDRFILAPDFFIGFEKYGYDFDFVTVLQFTEDGAEYPCYAATNEYMRFAGQVWVQEYRHIYDQQYINGGLIIMKTHTANKIMFNPMLMWSQMEDVELSEACMANGIIPRVNFVSTAMVLENPKGYLDNFTFERNISMPVSGNNGLEPYMFRSVNRITRRIPKWVKRNWLYQKLKRIYWGVRV